MCFIRIQKAKRTFWDTLHTIYNYRRFKNFKLVQYVFLVILKVIFYICISIDKKRKNSHRHDYSDGNAANKPTQAGTKTFIQQLLQREYPCALEKNIVKKIAYGSELTFEYFEKNGLECPLLIENKAGLGFLMPTNDEINLSQIQDIVGGEYKLGVIDVERQEEFAMSIKELNEYFNESKPREKVYNLISFEISKTKLTETIEAPNVVHQISWVSNGVWPNPLTAAAATSPRLDSTTPDEHVKPEVQKYCLISAENSYTDFHIDFGGSSVWYHLVKGDKIFYLIEPSEENLRAYENWYSQKNHNEIFLADSVKNCYRFKIKQGSTILLPSGWIHAVYTPFDSLVFGGNFLQSYSIPMQIKVYEMELRLNTHEKYRFPAFETLQWYAAKFYTQKLKEINLNKKCITNRLYHGLKFLNNTLKRWTNSKDVRGIFLKFQKNKL
jgi:[histone H3]-dimethyl-L-lysine9 demethylase